MGLSFLALTASMGIRSSFGAYVTPWEGSFSSTRGEISLISFVGFMVFGLGMPIAGRLTERFGARRVLAWSMVLIGISTAAGYLANSLWHMVILYGVISSIGFSGTSPVTISSGVVRWFTGKRGLALGVANSGIAVGQMALVPLNVFMIQALGWRNTVLILGLAYLVVLAPIFWLLYRDEPQAFQRDALDASSNRGVSNPVSAPARTADAKRGGILSLMLIPVTWMIVLPYFVCGFTDIGLFNTHFIPLAQGRGFSSQTVVMVVTLNAVANLVGVLFTGYLTDTMRLNTLLSATYAIRAVSIVLLYFAQDPLLLFAFGVVHGVTTAATIAPTTALCSRVYGSHRVGTVFGIMSLFHQFGAAAGSFVPGMVFDLTLSYNLALILSVAMLAVGSLVARLANEAREPRASK